MKTLIVILAVVLLISCRENGTPKNKEDVMKVGLNSGNDVKVSKVEKIADLPNGCTFFRVYAPAPFDPFATSVYEIITCPTYQSATIK